jgi:RimJ/RimL family protein N-acetyltransferase
MIFRQAQPTDSFKIIELYHEVYAGTYPDPMMKDVLKIKQFLETPHHFWFLALEQDSSETILASLLFRYDPDHRLGKVYAGAVTPRAQGRKVMTELMAYGLEVVKSQPQGLDVLYATTRSVHQAAQALVEHFGFFKLGIFPNTHKSAGDYETHTLAVWYRPEAFKERFTFYKMHRGLKNLMDIVEIEMPELLLGLGFIDPTPPTRELKSPETLEIIDATAFVQYRYEQLQKNAALTFEFYPFHLPNCLIVSPDQTIEMFIHFNPDGHCVVIGGKTDDQINYSELLLKMNYMLRDYGARYVELIVRADKPKVLDAILKAKMIPSAFIPAFQLKQGKRWDFVVFSKSFEIFDFQNIKLLGINQKYLEAYFQNWKQIALNPRMMELSSLRVKNATNPEVQG